MPRPVYADVVDGGAGNLTLGLPFDVISERDVEELQTFAEARHLRPVQGHVLPNSLPVASKSMTVSEARQ
jgi:hypothetical protein